MDQKYIKYKHKYIKYKHKYLMLKQKLNQIGGLIDPTITVGYEVIRTMANENALQLVIDPDNKYGKNIDNYNAWINKIKETREQDQIMNDYDSDDLAVLFALFLRDKMRYIPFSEFHDRIKKLVVDLASLLKADEYAEIYWLTDNVIKSNFWVLLLATLELEKHNIPQVILNKITIVFQVKRTKLNIDCINSKKYAFVYFDDMSYSGTQLLYNMTNNGFDDKTLANSHIYLFIPYISKTVQKLYKSTIFSFKYFHHTEFIDTLEDQLIQWCETYSKNAYKILRTVCPPLYNTDNDADFFMCGEAEGIAMSDSKIPLKIPIYFEHKLADDLSTFEAVLRYGLYSKQQYRNYYNKIPPENIPLINNCEQNLDDCPPTYYKTIKYTYNNKPITSYRDLTNLKNL
jgi:hypothetical protein